MIIIGAYPDSFPAGPDEAFLASTATPLRRLRAAMDLIAPPEIAVHLLPFYPSSGDNGFSADDWFSVAAHLGDWADIEALAASRRLIVDGIYNHVGRCHPWVELLLASPEQCRDIFFAFDDPGAVNGPLSPRGGPVLRPYELNGKRWHVWQTFSPTSFDVRMDHARIAAEIERHIAMLADRRVWGVRLDACAYYGKEIGQPQFHHPRAKEHARWIARLADAAGLQVIAQLDSDPEGLAYFPPALGYRVPGVDYAYTAQLVLALLREDTSSLLKHIWLTWRLNPWMIRPPRTHDGILLQSGLLDADDFAALSREAKRYALPVRVCDGEEYELNSSLPAICALGGGAATMWAKIDLIVTLTAFLPGWPYFYLPFLLGDVPEARWGTTGPANTTRTVDPRAMNRAAMDAGFLAAYLGSPRRHAGFRLLERLSMIKDRVGNAPDGQAGVDAITGSSVRIRLPGAGLEFVGNFSGSAMRVRAGPRPAGLLWGSHLDGDWLGPWGYGVWADEARSDRARGDGMRGRARGDRAREWAVTR